MNRRTFISAVSAFAGLQLAPAWSVFQQRRQIDLTPFCCDYVNHRYDVTKPFAQGGHVIGTDGRILVRTTLADVPGLADERKLPNIVGMPYWSLKADKWQPWPRAKYLGTNNRDGGKCPYCDGKGGTINLRPCVPCEGSGYRTIGDEYEANCKACKATGWRFDVECEGCKGTGWSLTACYQQVGGVIVASSYDARLRQLGDLEFCLLEGWDCVRFRGDGFDGLLMIIAVEPKNVRA